VTATDTTDTLDGKALCRTLARSIRLDGNLTRVHDLSDAELERLNVDVLTHLGRWINGKERDVRPCTTSISRFCTARSVPQLESAYYLSLIREGVNEFIHRQEFDTGELESQAARFFDRLVCEVLRA
jgi:hypothetical protein